MNECVHHRIDSGDGDFLHVQIRRPSNQIEIPYIIVFVHGFLGNGFENHRMFIRMSDYINQLGITCVLLDQYGCGYSDGEYEKVRLLKIKNDLILVSNWVSKHFEGKIGFIGQSMGSSLVLSSSEKIKASFVIAINPAADFSEWLTTRYQWDMTQKSKYYCAFPKGIYVCREFIEDLLNWKWVDELKNIQIPTFIIASKDDEICSITTMHRIRKKLGKFSKLKILNGINHSFVGQRDKEVEVASMIKDWIERYLIENRD